jgi:glycosyltransferase involved in cell wall biosynthesis
MAFPLSVSIVTRNEERNLERCLRSVADLASEIVVVDSGSSDATEEIAKRYGARFFSNPWHGYVAQKEFSFNQCVQPWVLSIDADEALSATLCDSIRQVMAAPPDDCDGWLVNRRTQYLGRWIWHVWYPEWILRLVRRGASKWVGLDPHAHMEVSSRVSKLDGDLLHYTYRDLDDQFAKLASYAQTTSSGKYSKGVRMSPVKLLFSPWLRFLRDLILKSAWRDGYRGVMIAYAGAFSSFMKQAYLYELECRERERDHE